MRVARLLLSALFVATISAPTVLAQSGPVTPDLEEGVKAFGDFYGGDIDQVSLSSGKLVLNIPLISYPQRGGKIKLGFSLRWQNITPRLTETYYSNTDTYNDDPERDGTALVGQLDFVDNLAWGAGGVQGAPPQGWAQASSPDQSLHQMLSTDSGTTWRSVDATGLLYSFASQTLQTPDGLRHIFSSGSQVKVEDPNGNFVTSTSTGWIDTLGRTITSPLHATATTDYSHCTGINTIISASTWTVPGPNGGSETFKFCYALYSYNWTYDPHTGSGPQDFGGSLSMLQSIVLPNLSNWTFQYDPVYAALSQITLPTGGTIGYTWGLNSAPCQYSKTSDSRQMTTTTKWGWWLAIASRTVNANDGTGPKTWTYSGGTITDPLGNQSVHTITGLGGTGSLYETEAQYYQGSSSTGTLLKTVTTDYSWNSFAPFNPVSPPYTCWNVSSVVPIRVTTTWPNGLVTKQETDYDSGFTVSPHGNFNYGEAIAKREYDYANGSPGPLLRQTKTSYIWQSNSTYLADNFLAYPSSTQVLDGSSVQWANTYYYYDQYSLASSGVSTQHDSSPPNGSYRANRTSVARWLNGSVASTANCPISVSNGYLYSYNLYFDAGTVQKATDSCGTSAGDPNHSTTYAYSPNYVGAWPTTITNALSQSISQTYDFNTGAVTSRTDPNNQTTTYLYNDSLGRLTEVDYPDQGVTKNFYTDTPLTVTVETQRKIDSTRWTDSFVLYNGLAHPVVRSAANDETTPWDRTDTCYDALGRAQFTSYLYQGSNATSAPNCSGTGDTPTYDGLGRLTQLSHSDGTTVLTGYTGRATQVQDEGNGTRRVSRISQVDGLARLASVCEVTSATQLGSGGTPAACGQDIAATGFLTTYGYDTLGNLTSTSQSGLNSRTFQYDSLSRLTSASNPESGTVCYGTYSNGVCQGNGYDANGNVITRTAPAPNQTGSATVTTTYGYDALNRSLSKSYSDGTTHLALFHYDETTPEGVTVSNPIGRLTSEDVGYASSAFSYDPLGRVISNWQCTPSTCGISSVQLRYTYDLAGDMTSSYNGRGVTLTYTVNGATRPTLLTSSMVDANHPGTLFSAAHYNAAGSLLSASLDNVISETRTYDPRLRLASITDGSNYSLTIPSNGGYAPNSDILAANDSVNGNWTYSYDDFNRLGGSNQNSGQSVYSYVYDRFGNRWQQNGAHSMQLSFSGANNRMDGYSYDAAGNLLNDGSHQYFYDAENRLIQMDGTLGNCATAAACYKYDAEGRRVQKATSSATFNYLYDMASRQFMEINSAGTWTRGEIYVGSRHIATYVGGTTYFIHPDWLGTERARADVTGALCETITSLPFGDGQSTSGSCSDASPLHFTGKQRDTESNLDYFGARFYGSSLGRFITPDWASKPTAVPYADFANPQSLNLYAYVKNNPLSNADSDGHCDASCIISIVTWAVTSVVRDGGAKPFAQNLGIGAAKGAGTFVYNAGKAVDTAFSSMGNPAAGVAAALKPGPAALQPSNTTQAQASGATQISLTVASALAPGLQGSGLSDSALVVRGGVPSVANLTKSAETIEANGTLAGISVNSANGASIEDLSQGIPNNQIGVTTVGDVRDAGGDVVPSPTDTNPCHCDMNGLTAEDASKLLKSQPNPSKVKTPQSQ